MPRLAITVHADDNVATLLDDLCDEKSTREGLQLKAAVPFGHKVALRPIAAGQSVVKYGKVIGVATEEIAAGDHVHVHNCR
jgi:altronate dehydratase